MAGPVHRTAAQPVVTVGQFVGVLRRRWISLLLALCIGGLAGFAYYKHVPASYQATAAVDITPPAGSGIDPKSVSTATEQKVVTSTQVATRAEATLGSTPEALLTHVTVTSPLNSLVLDVSYSAASAKRAADGANAFATAYISYRADTGRAQLNQRVQGIQRRLAPLQQQLTTLPDPSTQRSSVEAQIENLQQQLSQLDLTATRGGQLIGPAAVPSAPSGPKLMIYGTAGVIFGLLIGVVIAMARERRDDAIRDPADVEEAVGEPVLAVVPQARASRRRETSLATVSDPEGVEADAIRLLALKLLTAGPISADAARARTFSMLGDDKSGMMPANLAVTFARQGLRVALAGPTAALNRAAELLRVDPPFVLGESDFPEQVDVLDGPGSLYLLPLGDEVALDRMLRAESRQLSRLRRSVDALILDGANVVHESSALSLARYADAVVLLAREGATDCSYLRSVDRQLGQIGARVAGAVLLTTRRRATFHKSGGSRAPMTSNAPLHRRRADVTTKHVIDTGTESAHQSDVDISRPAYGTQL